MLARDFMSDVIPALKTSDTGGRALSWMETFRVSHLPIVNDKEFLGLISDSDIYDLGMIDEPIGNHKLSLFSPYVYSGQHIYDVIKIISRLKLTVVPVLDENKNYTGLIGQSDLLAHFATLAAVRDPGGLIVLEMNHHDYSISQIAQIVEGNNAKILSLYVTNTDQSTQMEVTIKVNKTDITSIIKTFERYSYNIKASFMDDENLDTFYRNRYEQFMRYLNI
ncbi:MAG: CBS domain-containing protein [Bacteroidales bacterium]